MIYQITRVTIKRKREDKPDSKFTFRVKHSTHNLKAYKQGLKDKYQATSVELDYTEIS